MRLKHGKDRHGHDYATKRKWVYRIYHERRSEWIRSQGSKCVRCGTTEPKPYRNHRNQLCDGWHLAHKDPTTKVSHSIWTWTKVRRDIELAKCELNCARCNLSEGSNRRWERDKQYQRAEREQINELEDAPF